MIPQSKNASLQSISREVELAWLAGILDGEGCLELNMKKAKNGKRYLNPKIRIYNTDIRMIEKVSRIYKSLNLVFFYTLGNNGKHRSPLTGKRWKTQIGICIASQGTTRKLLEIVMPYLVNKKSMAQIIIKVISLVQSCPRGGNHVRYNYTDMDEFKALWSEYETEKGFYFDPSTTTRCAGEILSW